MSDTLTMLGGLAVICAMIGIGLAAARALGRPPADIIETWNEPGDIERRARREM